MTEHAVPSPSRPAEAVALLPLATLPPLVLVASPASLPRWGEMWLLAAAVFAGFKWLTWWSADLRGVPASHSLAYLLGWPGLNAREFLHRSTTEPAARPGLREWLWSAEKVLFGALMIWGVARLVPAEHDLVRAWVGMIGIVFLLHFGSFDLLSCAWRTAGFHAEPLMDLPIAATSVTEFWGRRWNRAFRDLTHQFLFRPLSGRIGPRKALFAGFVFSGLVHDFVISVPADGGYGGPTAFFLLQGAALFFERSRPGQRLGLGRGVRGWLFTATVLFVPAPWLFHPPFLRRVILPFLNALGAL